MDVTLTLRIVLSLITLVVSQSELLPSKTDVNFVLLGATGDLAKKYLWQNLYQLSRQYHSKYNFKLYGGARAANNSGTASLRNILANNVKYDSDEDRERFAKTVTYVQLREPEHFENLCKTLRESQVEGRTCDMSGFCEDETENRWASTEQIFYLSVPPFTYADLGQQINNFCDLKDGKTKIVLEKPYGSDVDGVLKLIREFRSLFNDDQVYLVDHYLEKNVVRSISEFRSENREWLEPLLNGDHVERIEVIIKEEETAKGRLNYYDSYGVFLDMLQNHAMELLTLVAMDSVSENEIAKDSKHFVDSKLRFIESLFPITPRDLIYAQYSDYRLDGRTEFNDSTFDSNTATFGGVLLRSTSRRWAGVPMLLLSGKGLDAKSTYIRIKFKNPSYFSLKSQPDAKELIFAISPNFSPRFNQPCIAVSENLWGGGDNPLSEWELRENYRLKSFPQPELAYFRVVDDLVNGRQENFVNLKQLKPSWNLWALAIKHLSSLRTLRSYKAGDVEGLEFVLSSRGLEFGSEIGKPKVLDSVKFPATKALYNSELEIVNSAVDFITELAESIIGKRGSFHLAIPGGNTPKLLFQALTADSLFPWERTHVWFVDERCAKYDHADSNYRNAYDNFLKYVQIPPENVHGMPVYLNQRLCDESDNGSDLYAELIKIHTPENRFDLVILGVGADGHVASLFPGVNVGDVDPDVKVILSEAPSSVSATKPRMTLTWSSITSAEKVLVMIVGADKRAMVKEVFTGTRTYEEIPVKNLHARDNVYFLIAEDKEL